MTSIQYHKNQIHGLAALIVSACYLLLPFALQAQADDPQGSSAKPASEAVDQKKDGEAEAKGDPKDAKPDAKAKDKKSEKADELAKLKIDEPLDPALYVIRPSDKVEIKIYGEEKLSGEKTVDDAGVISLELVGRLKVAGMTVKDAEKFIREKYEEDYLFNPEVTFNVIEKAKRRFVILGQVRSPGVYEVPRSIRLDIFQAIALAGGYTRIAGRVTIKRTTSRGEETLRYRLSRLRKKPISEIPIVAEDDTVIVGESYF